MKIICSTCNVPVEKDEQLIRHYKLKHPEVYKKIEDNNWIPVKEQDEN